MNTKELRSFTRRAATLGLASALVIGALPAMADFPEKNIEFVVPWSAGGGNDTVARTMQPGLEEALDTNIVIRNIAGGGGAVGFSKVIASKPDGYTVTIPNNANFTLEGLGNVNFSYKDLDYIARVIVEPYVLAVKNNENWSDLEALKSSLEDSGEPLRIGVSGVGSSSHIVAMTMLDKMGIDYQVIPFNGGPASVSATLGGHIDGLVLAPSEIRSAVESGGLTPIVSSGEDRNVILPETPTMEEKGYDFSLLQWRGIAAPDGLDPQVEEKWVSAVKQLVEDPKFQKTINNMGGDVSPLYGKELDSFVDRTAEIVINQAKKINNQ